MDGHLCSSWLSAGTLIVSNFVLSSLLVGYAVACLARRWSRPAYHKALMLLVEEQGEGYAEAIIMTELARVLGTASTFVTTTEDSDDGSGEDSDAASGDEADGDAASGDEADEDADEPAEGGDAAPDAEADWDVPPAGAEAPWDVPPAGNDAPPAGTNAASASASTDAAPPP